MATSRPVLIAALAAASFTGCGGTDRVSVSGQVTLDGEPLPEGAITFYSPETKVAAAAAIRDGGYALPAENGLSPGKQVVRVMAFRPKAARPGRVPRPEASGSGLPASDPAFAPGMPSEGPPPPAQEQYLPARFNTKSELTADLAPGRNGGVDFRLTR